jgi:hypothetical protein
VHSSCQRTPISWSLHTWESPLVHLHAQGIHFPNLGARETPSFVSLRTWVRVSSSRRPYILPTSIHCHPPKTSTKYTISKSLPEIVPPLQLSLLETPSFVPTENPKFFQSGNPKFSNCCTQIMRMHFLMPELSLFVTYSSPYPTPKTKASVHPCLTIVVII